MADSDRIGVILGQIGVPKEPTPSAFRPYLDNFLSDDRVIDAARWWWRPFLKFFLAPKRARSMAEQYEEIWEKVGAPLLTISEQQARGLQDRLGPDFEVALGLTYAGPSIESALRAMEQAGIRRIVVLPLFPQFSTTTTAAIYDEVMLEALGRSKSGGEPRKKYVPALRFIPPYFDDPAYMRVLAGNLRRQLEALPTEPDRIIVSFHGIPVSYVREGDPYQEHVERTYALLKDALAWTYDERVVLRYQSRFGRNEWLQPYTSTELANLPRQGVRHAVIVAPGFTTDNMETLYELDIEARETIAANGGDPATLHRLDCLNSDPDWLDYLADLVRSNAQGW